MDNLELYNAGRGVPDEAKKPIEAGRLKGFTDITPMWRIKRLTEMFGPCGIGWWYEITDKYIEDGAQGTKCAFVDVLLYYRYNGETSQGIPGTGGSSYISNERNGPYTSDECYKMALTDALSVAAKAIGIGADVYYAKDRDKYTPVEHGAPSKTSEPVRCAQCGADIQPQRLKNSGTMSVKDYELLCIEQYGMVLCNRCRGKLYADRVSSIQKRPTDSSSSN